MDVKNAATYTGLSEKTLARADNVPLKRKSKKKTKLLPFNSRFPYEIPDVLTDQRIAQSFADFYYEGLLYWPEAGKWLVYDERRWNTDSKGGPFPFLKTQIMIWHGEAAAIENDEERIEQTKKILSLENYYRQETIIKAAKVIPKMLTSASQLDNDAMLLNCLNGTIDLRTGELREHDPRDFITRITNIEYDPDAKCPLWYKFLNRIFAGNQQVIDYVQRFTGYCLTGKTDEQMLLFGYGTGQNGKTVYVNILSMLLGDFASVTSADLLMMRDHNKPTNDLAALRGARLVKVSEFNESERLNEAMVKTLTGGDEISCRFLYHEPFGYYPRFKIVLIGNHKPRIQGRDLGIWRRIHLLPFNVTIPEGERDPQLLDKLKNELPGIMAWAVQGCLEWQKTGLCPPSEVADATKDYRQSEDLFSSWLTDCCERDNNERTPVGQLLDSYVGYTGQKYLTPQKFGRMLADAGFQRGHNFAGALWGGIKLKRVEHDMTD